MTFFVFLLVILASLGLHRILNYERISEKPRLFLKKRLPFGIGNLITCAACNALWIAAAVATFALLCPYDWAAVLLLTFATYPFVRLAVWTYWYATFIRARLQNTQTPGAFTQPAKQGAFTQPPAGCIDCEEKKIAAHLEQKRVLGFKKRVVIIATLADFHASYSVSSCVIAQARMLAQDPTWLVQVWVNQTASDEQWPKNMPANVELRKVLPAVRFADDVYDEKIADLLYSTLMRELMALGNATVITHDVLFQKAYLSFAGAIHRIGDLKGFKWWHQSHSGPNPVGLPSYPLAYRYSLPMGDHRILCLASSQKAQFAAHYNITEPNVDVLPNSRDPRTLLRASTEISEFISKHALSDADVVQVYPFSTPRAWEKGVHKVIRVFEHIKKQGKSVRLVLPNAHANGNEQTIAELRAIAAACDLTDEEVIFTSDHFSNKHLSAGLPEHDVQVLFQFANLFIFPTIGEASSLVQMEAALSGSLLMLNSDVPALSDITGSSNCQRYSFGTDQERTYDPADPRYRVVADHAVAILGGSFTNRAKREVLKNHSLDALGVRLRALLAG